MVAVTLLQLVFQHLTLPDLVVNDLVDDYSFACLSSDTIHYKFARGRRLPSSSRCRRRRSGEPHLPRRQRQLTACVGSLLLEHATDRKFDFAAYQFRYREVPLQLQVLLAFRDVTPVDVRSDFPLLTQNKRKLNTDECQRRFFQLVHNKFLKGFGDYQLALCRRQLDELVAEQNNNNSDSGYRNFVHIRIMVSRLYVTEANYATLNAWHCLLDEAFRSLLPRTSLLLFDIGWPSTSCGCGVASEYRYDFRCAHCTKRIMWRRKMISFVDEHLHEAIQQQQLKYGNSSASDSTTEEFQWATSWPLATLCAPDCNISEWFTTHFTSIGLTMAKCLVNIDFSWQVPSNAFSYYSRQEGDNTELTNKILPPALNAVKTICLQNLEQVFSSAIKKSQQRRSPRTNPLAVSVKFPTSSQINQLSPQYRCFPAIQWNELFPSLEKVQVYGGINARCDKCCDNHIKEAENVYCDDAKCGGNTCPDEAETAFKPKTHKYQRMNEDYKSWMNSHQAQQRRLYKRKLWQRFDSDIFSNCKLCSQNYNDNYDLRLCAPLYSSASSAAANTTTSSTTASNHHYHPHVQSIFTYRHFSPDDTTTTTSDDSSVVVWQTLQQVQKLRRTTLCSYCLRLHILRHIKHDINGFRTDRLKWFTGGPQTSTDSFMFQF